MTLGEVDPLVGTGVMVLPGAALDAVAAVEVVTGVRPASLQDLITFFMSYLLTISLHQLADWQT